MYYQVFKLKDQNSNRPLAIIQTVKSMLEVACEIFTHDDPVELVSRHTKIGWKQAEMI